MGFWNFEVQPGYEMDTALYLLKTLTHLLAAECYPA